MSPARVAPGVNPLRDARDKRLPRIAGPCGLVLFGVTGDLARKKLMPAIYDLANRGLLPPGFSLVGFARRDWATPGLRQGRARRGQGARAHPVQRGRLAQPLGGLSLRSRNLRRPGRVRPARPDGARARPGPGYRRQPRVLPLGPTGLLRHGVSAARPVRADPGRGRPLAPGHHREALRPRPQERPTAQRDRRGRLLARLGVPHRPLPGQGDGAEPAGVAFRQPALRAGLERQLRRPRSDHDGRGHRDRRSGRILRRHRRRPRRHPEPPVAAAGPHRHGGARLVRRQEPPGREGEGALGGPTARQPREGFGSRAVRRRVAGGRGGRRVPRRGRRRRRVDHRDLRSGGARGRHAAAGRGFRSTCAPANGWASG